LYIHTKLEQLDFGPLKRKLLLITIQQRVKQLPKTSKQILRKLLMLRILQRRLVGTQPPHLLPYQPLFSTRMLEKQPQLRLRLHQNNRLVNKVLLQLLLMLMLLASHLNKTPKQQTS
jgi:hypothetical protein